jgi:hypothetical protein
LTLPSLEDVVFVIVLLLPGFFSIVLFKKIGIREKKISDFESTIWSLFASLSIYAVFGYLTGVNNLETIKNSILNPLNISLIFGLAILIGGGFGLLNRWIFRRGIKAGTCWEAIFRAAAEEGTYVLVYTANNEEYKGELQSAGVAESPKEIVVKNPKLILRNADLSIKSEMKIGTCMIFNENDVRRVVFLKDILKQKS